MPRTEAYDLGRQNKGDGIIAQIHDATYQGDVAQVKRLLAPGADVNEPAEDGWPPLNIAAFQGHTAVAEGKIGKVPDENYLYWVTEPEGVDPKDPADIDLGLLTSTRKMGDRLAQLILDKDFLKLGKQNDDLCGICEFEQRCWR